MMTRPAWYHANKDRAREREQRRRAPRRGIEDEPKIRELRQVVMNLLSNALEFTPAGGRVRLEVARNGSTVPREVADTGSGIGLTVVAELARAHRGTVDVESEPGQGTRVSVSLPRA